jgi:uncharacterized protein (TIGR00369 family)
VGKATEIPEGFKALESGISPFISSLGPLYVRGEGGAAVIAMRIERKHMNTRGVAHGGVLMALADSALGIVLRMSQANPGPMVTVSLTADFVDAARVGDWVEVRVDVQKVGKRLAFANCQLWVGEKRILRASGVFSRVAPSQGEGPFEG